MANNLYLRRGHEMSEKDNENLLNQENLKDQEDIREQQDEFLEEKQTEALEEKQTEQEETHTEQQLEQTVTTKSATKVWMVASIVLFAALIYALIQPPFGKSNDTVASVNGISISKDMFYDEMIKTGGAPILDNMITEELLNQEAKESGITVTDSDVDNEITMYKKNYPSEEEWIATLAQRGTTEEQLRTELVKEIQLRKLLEPQTPVTDEEINLFYTENLEAMSTPDKVPTLDEKKEEIRYQLVYQKLSEVFPAWIEEVKAKAEIENSLEVKTEEVEGTEDVEVAN